MLKCKWLQGGWDTGSSKNTGFTKNLLAVLIPSKMGPSGSSCWTLPRNFILVRNRGKPMKTMHQMHRFDVVPAMCMCARENDLYVIKSITPVEKNKHQ